MKQAAVLALAVAACQPPGTSTSTPHPPPVKQYSVLDLVGGWRWLYRTQDSEQGTRRIEEENWRFTPDPSLPMRLLGRYIRDVEVRSTDGVPFKCNQRPWYRQRSMYDVTLDLEDTGLVIKETAYDTEASPCDHGFRKMTDYQAEAHGNRLVLNWPSGTQTLMQVDSATTPLPDSPWTKNPGPLGAWRWQATSYDDDGNIRDEAEWWEISKRTDTQLDATYRRRVTTRSPDGKPIVCANAPSWSFDDAYILKGQKEEEHWHFYELAVEPGDHPCTRTTPKRTTDEATAEQIGSYFILEWRGKRRQILYRPDDE